MNSGDLNINSSILEKVKSRTPSNSSPFTQGVDGDQYRFSSFIQEYCRQLIEFPSGNKSGYAYFVFIPPESIRDVENIGNKLLQLKKLKSFNLEGSIVLCLDTTLNNTRIVKFEGNGIELWNTLAEEFENFQTITGKALCHAIIDFKSKVLTVSIIDLYDDVKEYSFDLNADVIRFSRDDLECFSNKFHEEETKFPSCALVVWDNQTNFKLFAKAEERIVTRFAWHLTNILGRENIGREPQGPHGRIDLFIHSSAMTNNQGPCVMEFKVLRHGEGEEKCEKWLYSGILQAVDYGKDKAAKSLYLMAYDGRKVHSKISRIEDFANLNNVIYQHFTMYNTVDGERKEILGKK